MATNTKRNANLAADDTANTAPPNADTALQSTDTAILLAEKTIEIADQDVTLNNRWADQIGQPITADWIKVRFLATVGQFRNNQRANADNRAKRLKAATEENDAAKMADNQPLTVEAMQALWADYAPDFGSVERGDNTAKLHDEARWRFWSAHVKAHNDDIAAGGQGTMPKSPGVPVALPSGKGAPAEKEAIIRAIAASDAYTDRVRDYIDAVIAEQGKKKAGDSPTVVKATASLV